MAPPRKRQKVSTASLSTDMSLSRNVSAASTHSTPPHTPPSQSQISPPQGAGIFTPNHVKHLIANLDIELRDRATRLRNHYNLLASTLRIRGEARMSRVPSHLRGIKIKELREMQKRGITREKQLLTDVLGTRLLASTSRPMLKRKPSEDEVSDADAHAVKRVFSQNSEPDRSPSKNGTSVLPRTKGRPVTTGGGRSNSRTVTRGASVNKRGRK